MIALQFRLLRAARAMLDPMLNLGLIDRERARLVLEHDVGLSPAMARQELDRYTFNAPGQAGSYFYGYSRILELRMQTELALGPAFDRQAFNDFLLDQDRRRPTSWPRRCARSSCRVTRARPRHEAAGRAPRGRQPGHARSGRAGGVLSGGVRPGAGDGPRLDRDPGQRRGEHDAQVSLASEGGSGTPVPQLSIEVDDMAGAYARVQALGAPVEYPLTDEPWACGASSCAIRPDTCSTCWRTCRARALGQGVAGAVSAARSAPGGT